MEEQYRMVCPTGFTIPLSATKIHNISTEEAIIKGEPIKLVACQLYKDIEKYKVTHFVAHNAYFDFNVVCSELYRLRMHNMISKLFAMERYCTMINGRKILKLSKNPRLSELYELVTKRQMVGAHDAQCDTRACKECLKHLLLQTT